VAIVIAASTRIAVWTEPKMMVVIAVACVVGLRGLPMAEIVTRAPSTVSAAIVQSAVMSAVFTVLPSVEPVCESLDACSCVGLFDGTEHVASDLFDCLLVFGVAFLDDGFDSFCCV